MAPNSDKTSLILGVSREGDVLFKITVALKEVTAFWVRYAMGDD